jgi:DNA-binding CsgD family transcriptional regulator
MTSAKISLERTSQALFDTAIDAARWPATVDVLAQYSGSPGAALEDGQGFFGEREQADLVRFSGRLGEAAVLSRSLADANAIGAMEAYQSIGCASFLIDKLGQVLRFNQAAERLFGDGLELSHGRLRASHPPSNTALGDLIASWTRSCGNDRHADWIAVLHRPAKRPLIVKVIAMSGLAASVFSSASAILLVSDAEKRHRPTPLDVLTEMFALTMTEARLVSMLERELPLSEAAALMNITFETARTHLKRILAKTQTKRQQDLLMLLHRLRP